MSAGWPWEYHTELFLELAPNTEVEACKVFAALTGEIGTIPGNWVIQLSPSEV